MNDANENTLTIEYNNNTITNKNAIILCNRAPLGAKRRQNIVLK